MQTRHVVGLAAGTLVILGASSALVIGALGAGSGAGTGPAGQSSPAATSESSVAPSGAASRPSASAPGQAESPAGVESGQAPNPDFGFIVGLADTGPGAPQRLVFDRATLLTGEAAAEEAASRGEEAFDYYIVNDNPRLRELQVSDSGLVVHGSWYLAGRADPKQIGPDDLFHYLLNPRAEKLPVELRYDVHGLVVEVTEVYFP